MTTTTETTTETKGTTMQGTSLIGDAIASLPPTETDRHDVATALVAMLPTMAARAAQYGLNGPDVAAAVVVRLLDHDDQTAGATAARSRIAKYGPDHRQTWAAVGNLLRTAARGERRRADRERPHDWTTTAAPAAWRTAPADVAGPTFPVITYRMDTGEVLARSEQTAADLRTAALEADGAVSRADADPGRAGAIVTAAYSAAVGGPYRNGPTDSKAANVAARAERRTMRYMAERGATADPIGATTANPRPIRLLREQSLERMLTAAMHGAEHAYNVGDPVGAMRSREWWAAWTALPAPNVGGRDGAAIRAAVARVRPTWGRLLATYADVTTPRERTAPAVLTAPAIVLRDDQTAADHDGRTTPVIVAREGAAPVAPATREHSIIRWGDMLTFLGIAPTPAARRAAVTMARVHAANVAAMVGGQSYRASTAGPGTGRMVGHGAAAYGPDVATPAAVAARSYKYDGRP